MPELPEVESIRKSLTGFLIGKTIDRIFVSKAKQFIGDPLSLEGYRITRLTRHGKIMHWHLGHAESTGRSLRAKPDETSTSRHARSDKYINIHLKMSGRLSFIPTEHTRVTFVFTDGSHLYFNDPRTFGWVKVNNRPEITKGADILSPLFTEDYFMKQVSTQTRDIKTILLDQDLIAGIGNIYANDALWEARINPFRKGSNLSKKQIHLLFEAVRMVIADGVKRGGASKTWVYRLPNGASGEYQNHFRVYDQEGKKCKRCHTIIKRIAKNGRSSFMCPSCQK